VSNTASIIGQYRESLTSQPPKHSIGIQIVIPYKTFHGASQEAPTMAVQMPEPACRAPDVSVSPARVQIFRSSVSGFFSSQLAATDRTDAHRMTYPGNGPVYTSCDLWPSSMLQDLCQSIQPPTIGACRSQHASLC
jgi:hypothetical protein